MNEFDAGFISGALSVALLVLGYLAVRWAEKEKNWRRENKKWPWGEK